MPAVGCEPGVAGPGEWNPGSPQPGSDLINPVSTPGSRPVEVVARQPDPLRRTGTPVQGRTVPEVVSQLAWRVLGPYKDRARSVLDWAGLAGQPPGTLRLSEVARRYGVTSRAVGQRVQRTASRFAAARSPPTSPDTKPRAQDEPPAEDHRTGRPRCVSTAPA